MIDVPDYVIRILNILESPGFEAYTVGGCVRDGFLGKPPSDWDITTSAHPENVLELFSDFTTIPTGLKHGTVTVINEGIPVEITTYRIDGKYTDCRHPQSVAFSSNIEDDLSRRDFTINAMAYSPTKGLKDPFNGQMDLNNKLLRCVGDATKRFSEDALRIMRALRFAATLNFEIEVDTDAAIRSCAHLLKNIAKERLCTELSKLLLAENPERILLNYKNIFYEILDIKSSVSDTIWAENCKTVSLSLPYLPLRLALMLNGLPVWDILQHLKFSNAIKHTTEIISKGLNAELLSDKTLVKKQLREFGAENMHYIIKGKSALCGNTENLSHIEEIISDIKTNGECYLISQLDINGQDLLEHLDIQGPEIGNALEVLLDAVIYGKCENKKNSLLEFLKK